MIQDSSVWLAWVSRAIEGSATFREATAATTVARASMTTGSTAGWTPPRGSVGEAGLAVVMVIWTSSGWC